MWLRYNKYNIDGILGDLFFEDDDGARFCAILTHAYLQSDGKYLPKLPPGHYKCERGDHVLSPDGIRMHHLETFEVLGVAGHSGILFHPGNWQRDSKGCLLLGRDFDNSAQGTMVTRSVDTFKFFMDCLTGLDEFELEVEDGRS